MRIEKTEIEFVIFDARDVIATSDHGTIGSVGYYWISKNGVDAINNNSNYYLMVPLGRGNMPLDYQYAQYTAGSQTLVKDQYGEYFQWGISDHRSGSLEAAEIPYLITDDEIANRFDEVISWLKDESVRN